MREPSLLVAARPMSYTSSSRFMDFRTRPPLPMALAPPVIQDSGSPATSAPNLATSQASKPSSFSGRIPRFSRYCPISTDLLGSVISRESLKGIRFQRPPPSSPPESPSSVPHRAREGLARVSPAYCKAPMPPWARESQTPCSSWGDIWGMEFTPCDAPDNPARDLSVGGLDSPAMSSSCESAMIVPYQRPS